MDEQYPPFDENGGIPQLAANRGSAGANTSYPGASAFLAGFKRYLPSFVSASPPAPATPAYASDADNAREMAGMQRGARGGAYAAPGAAAAAEAANNTYGPNDGFGFRDRLAKGGKPGEVLNKDYGFGGQTVNATADKNGRFNSFSGGAVAAAAPGTPAPLSPLEVQMQQLSQRAAYYRAKGTLTGRIFAANAMKQLSVLQAQGVASGHLGVAAGQLQLAQQQANPDIQYKTMLNMLTGSGDNEATQKIVAARAGNPNTHVIPTMSGTYVDSASNTGFYPGFPAVNGQSMPVQPVQPLPSLTRLRNNDGY